MTPSKGTPALPKVYEFATDTWPSCITMRPVVDGLVKKYAGKYDIRIMNGAVTDPNLVAKLANMFSIRFVPTFVFLNSDGSLNQTVVGAVPVSRIESELAKLS